MESMLVIITLLALVTTTVMAGVAWTLMRDERRRSDARVAALAAAIDLSAPPASTPETAGIPERVPARRDDGPVAAPELFASTTQPSHDATERLFPALVTGAVVMTSCLAAALLLSSIPAAGAPGMAPSSEGSMARPLELLTLESRAVGQRIELLGVVRNPDGAAPVTTVGAVVSYFGRNGEFLGSNQSKLVGPLRAGEEARFAVSGDITGDVARYRVSFRGAGDRPLSHRDRREGR